MTKNKLLRTSLTLLLALGAVSCMQSPPVNIQPAAGQQENVSDGARVKLVIRQPLTTKASTDGALPKTFDDILSFSAFLTTNPTDPFAAGSNPAGDGVVFNVDKGRATETTVITLVNVPPGGPYYAVVAAYDGLSSAEARTNITEPNALIDGERWNISGNSVTVNSDLSLTFNSGGDSVVTASTQLDVFLQLQHGVPPQVDTSITPIDGNSDSTPFEAF